MRAAKAVRRWGVRGVWSLTDQALFAGSNFLVNVLLARWITHEDYGAFTVAFTLFLLTGTIHTALLTEPMLVFGSGRYDQGLRPYIALVVRGHFALSAVFALLLLVGSFASLSFAGSQTAGTLMVLAATTPALLLSWLLRRAVYIASRPDLAAGGGLAYMVCVILGLSFLYREALLSPQSAILLMGAASLAGSAVIWAGLSKAFPPGGVVVAPELRDVAREHWRYGRWSLATALLAWLPGNIYFLALPFWTGLEGTAGLRAILNLYMPVMHAIVAIGVLLLPALVRRRDGPEFRVLLLRIGLAMVGIAIAYSGLLVFFGPSLAHWLYAGRYLPGVKVFIALLLLPVAAAIAAVYGGALRSIERPDLVFRAYVGGSIFTVTVGLGLAWKLGVTGAAAGWSLSYLVTAVLLAMSFPRSHKVDSVGSAAL
jgi:O-antigen/teichoic acid export membrane protein